MLFQNTLFKTGSGALAHDPVKNQRRLDTQTRLSRIPRKRGRGQKQPCDACELSVVHDFGFGVLSAVCLAF